MQLLTNSIDTDTVREETRNGREYLVADVTVARPMSLNGGYVPDEAFAESVPGWNHVPLPIGHPVNVNGDYISSRIPEVIDNAVVGSLYYADYDHDIRDLSGNLYVDVETAENRGAYGNRILEILEDGEELEVSSAYRGDPGAPGVYSGVDGEHHREEVKVNIRPDHVALLPDDLGPGKCSCADGCGVAPSEGLDSNVEEGEPLVNTIGVSGHTLTANGPGDLPGAGYCVNGEAGTSADRVFVNMRSDGGTTSAGGGRDRQPSSTESEVEHNSLTQARDPSYDVTESSSWGDVSKTFENFYSGYPDADEDVSSWSEASQDARQWISSKSMLGEADADTFDGGLIHPVVNPSTNNLNEGALDAILGSRGETDKASDDAIESSRSKSRSLLESEFDRDLDSNESTNTNANSTDMITNQTEGDRVRWQSDNGNWRYGIVADEADSSEEVEDDEVLIAVYTQEEDGWTRSDEEVTVKEENLEEIDEFPSEAMSSNDDGDDADTPDLHGNILAEARTPEYTTTAGSDQSGMESWELWWSLDEYLEAWAEETGADYQGDPYSALSEVPDDARGWIAAKSLLGNPDAETEENLLLGAVVSPDGVLHEELLEDVLGSEGSRWTVPDEQRESARSVARQLLSEEFGREFDDVEANAEEALGTIHSLLQRIGLVGNSGGDEVTAAGPADATNGGGSPCDCDTDGTHEGCHCNDSGGDGTNHDHDEETETNTTETQTNSMSPDLTDEDYDQIANATNFSNEQLRRMDDEQVSSLNTLVKNADDDGADEGGDGGDADSESADDDGSDDDDEGDDVEANDDDLPEAVQNQLEELSSTVEAQQEKIEKLTANHEAEEQRERNKAAETIQANSDQYSEDQLEAMDTDLLKTTANALSQSSNATDFGGLNEPFPARVDGNSDGEEAESTSSGGSFRQFLANKEEADD